MGRLTSRYDQQTTLNYAIAKIDLYIEIEMKRLRWYTGTSYLTAYNQAWEMLSFYRSRRRVLLRRLIQLQIKEFKR